MALSLKEAADATGLAKSTIYRAVKTGKLSASLNLDDEYEVAEAELFRVYPPKKITESAPESEAQGEGFAHYFKDKFEASEREVKEIRDQLSDTQNELMDTHKRLEEHREAARLLEHTTAEQQKQIDLAKQETTQTKREAEQQAKEWQAKLAERQAEIQAARTEAEALSEKAAKDIAQIERRAAEERKAREQLQSRGLIARIFNRPVAG